MAPRSVRDDMSSAIKQEADVLLYDIGLAPTLSKYGKVFPTGSYAMDLMTWRDLDIYLDIEHVDKNRMYDLVHEMAALLQPFWLEAKSMLDNPEPGFPHGYFIGMETRLVGSNVWNIDLIVMALQDILQAQDEMNQRMCKINPVTRKVVLELKNHPHYLKNFFSTDVYDAVINSSVRSVDELERWLEARATGDS